MRSKPPVTRVAWVDYAKAIGIVAVVLGHVVSALATTPDMALGPGLVHLNGFLYSFHMPLFFLLAGVVVQLRPRVTPRGLLDEVLWALVLPYLLWSMIWVALKVGARDLTDNPVTLARLGTILWEPIGHLWFLYQLLLVRFGWYAMERALPFGGRTAVLLVAAIASVHLAPLGEPWLRAWFFLQNFAFFGLGLLVLPYLELPRRGLQSLLACALSLLAWMITYPGFGGLDGPATPFLLAALGTLATVLLARALPDPRGRALRLFAFLGEASMAIYLMHLLVTFATRKALAHAGWLSEDTFLVIASGAGVLLPAIAFWIIVQMSGLTGLPLTGYLGLGRTRNSRYLPCAGAASAPAGRPVNVTSRAGPS
jgi:fucose 4-O-acetylase-like acetyltransferase